MLELADDILHLEDKLAVSEEDIWKVHNKFEIIHPFDDGNGRTGRLLFNWLSLRHLGEFYMFMDEKRQDYYDMIDAYDSEFRKDHPEMVF
jgi:Fic family protein